MTKSIHSPFSLVDHEVCVLTSGSEPGQMVGFTATWVLPGSLLPGTPRFVVLASPLNQSLVTMRRTRRAVLHLLAADQVSLMVRFGLESGGSGSKFRGIPWRPSAFGPIIEGVAGYVTGEWVHEVDLGERRLMVFDAGESEVNSAAGRPLTKKQAFAELDEATVAKLQQKHSQLAEQSRALWRTFNGGLVHEQGDGD